MQATETELYSLCFIFDQLANDCVITRLTCRPTEHQELLKGTGICIVMIWIFAVNRNLSVTVNNYVHNSRPIIFPITHPSPDVLLQTFISWELLWAILWSQCIILMQVITKNQHELQIVNTEIVRIFFCKLFIQIVHKIYFEEIFKKLL